MIGSAALILLSMFNILTPSANPNWPMYVSAAFVAWAALYLATTYWHFRSPYLFTTAYVVSLAVFHMGYIIAHAIGWKVFASFVQGDMVVWYGQAGWYCVLAFAAIGFGLALSLNRFGRPAIITPEQRIEARANLVGVYEIGAILYLASVLALILLAGSVGNILRFSRADIFAGVGDTRGLGFFLAVAPSAMVLMATSADTKRRKLIAYPLAALTFVGVLFLGYRSNALFPAFVGAIIWVKLGKRIPLYVGGSALAFVIVAIPAVSYLRAQGPYENISAEDVAQSIEQANAEEVVLQLGGVATAIAYTLKWVPAEDPYRLGQSYLLAIINSIPNLSLTREDSGRAEAYRGGIADEEQVQNMSPGDWFTFRVSRWLFNKGGGAGYSTIAEAYLNFGLPGVVIFFGALGFLLGRLDQVDLQSSPKSYLFSGALLWPLVKTVRNHFGVFMKPATFIIVTIVLWKLVSFWRARRRPAPLQERSKLKPPAGQQPMAPADVARQDNLLHRSRKAGLLRRCDTHEDTSHH